jgi:4-methyl-5(b-hydroxyethyl)-thiazole monophosphate biosynthesis
VQSDKIITAKGAGVAVDFGLKLAEVLCGAEKSKEIRKSIQCM